ncbi:T-kininogen 1-like [Phyllobates terribilis]|uniref:T-kininogen 1-like n=1 Tax=Phyllobates terribilis TaxID=111132 RepID=UPI003CCB2632
MWFLSILVLFFHCPLGSATVIDADCNDQNVFSAVDVALRCFNDAKEAGNQLILYRTTDAKIKPEEDGYVHYFVEYEAQEGSCEVMTGKSWQECLPTYTHQAKCSAHVLINDDLKVRRVESQNCSIPKALVWSTETAVEYPCLGCIQPIDKENKELLCFAHSTIEQVNTDANYQFYLDLESIVNATRQVVNGWKYHIQFLLRQTNCSKSNFPSRNSKECKIDKAGESFVCTARVHVTPDGNANYSFLECKSDTGVCINCPVMVDSEDPELRTLLVQVMDEYNVNSNHTELYDVSFVDSAIKKGFKGELYVVTFTIKATNCSKTDYSMLGDECAFINFSPQLICETKIKVTDKTVNVHSDPHCRKEEFQMFGIRIGGLSPLRMSRKTNQKENDERPNRQRQHGHNNNKGNKHGKKDRKNKHTFQDSSEENSENEVTQAPLQLTIPATQKPGNVATDIVPRCPGRVWYPSLVISNPTVKTFSNHDLLLAIGDSTPSSDQERKKNEPPAPKQVLPFNDEDLLG